MYTPTGFDASNYVTTFNTSFNFMLAVSLFFIVFLTSTMIYFVYRYNRKKHKKAEQIEGSNALEITWTVIPILLALGMFYYGWSGYTPMNKVPDNALNVTTIGRMWSFTFLYENGRQSPELVVPVSQPVNLKLISLDVLHSVFIPEFRLKSDIVPGREKTMWFRSDREGEYDLFCAEYCGLRHSYMSSMVRVLPQEEFDKWYADTTKVVIVPTGTGPGAEGEAIMRTLGCFACHTSDGSKLIGPSYLNLWGEEQVVLRGGKEFTVTVNEDYVRRSILDPNSEITRGYPSGLMQPYKGQITDEDIQKIIEYLQTLHE